MNTPFFQVPTLEFGHGAGTWAKGLDLVHEHKSGYRVRRSLFAHNFVPEIKYLNQNLKKQANRPKATFSPYVPIPFRLARFSIAPVGSEPMDRKHMSGVLGLLSSQVASRFRITPSAYLSPMVSAMYLRA